MISLIITLLELALRYEPQIAASIRLAIPALREQHALHGDSLTLGEIEKLLLNHKVDLGALAGTLRVGPEGHTQPQV